MQDIREHIGASMEECYKIDEDIELMEDEELDDDMEICVELTEKIDYDIQECNRLEIIAERLHDRISVAVEGHEPSLDDGLVLAGEMMDISTEGFKEFVIAIWDRIKRFIMALVKNTSYFYRRVFGQVVRTQRRAKKMKERSRHYKQMPIQNTSTDITDIAHRLAIAGSTPKDGPDLLKSIDSMVGPIEALEWSGIANQGPAIHAMLQDFKPDDTFAAAKQLIEFAGNLEVINRVYQDVGSKGVHPDIRDRKSEIMDVSSIEVFGNKSIVTMINRRAKAQLTDLRQETQKLRSFNTSEEGEREAMRAISESKTTILRVSRDLRKSGVYMENTFRNQPLMSSPITIKTLTYQDISSVCDAIIRQTDMLKKYEFSKVMRTQRSYGDKILKEGNKLDKRMKKLPETQGARIYADMWREMSLWASYFAKSTSSYQPQLIRRLIAGYNASIRVCSASLSNHRRPIQDTEA